MLALSLTAMLFAGEPVLAQTTGAPQQFSFDCARASSHSFNTNALQAAVSTSCYCRIEIAAPATGTAGIIVPNIQISGVALVFNVAQRSIRTAAIDTILGGQTLSDIESYAAQCSGTGAGTLDSFRQSRLAVFQQVALTFDPLPGQSQTKDLYCFSGAEVNAMYGTWKADACKVVELHQFYFGTPARATP